jgi:hypothetical protein
MASSISYLNTRRVFLSLLHLDHALLIALVRLIIVFNHECNGCVLFCLYQ